jgi:hypothetical protein
MNLKSMNKLGNYITGHWVTGDGEGQVLYNAVTGEPITTATTRGLDFKGILDHGRKVGNPALRKLTFHERGNMLKATFGSTLIIFITSAIKRELPKQIAGSILKEGSEIFSPMLLCAENSRMSFFAWMGNHITWARTIHLLGHIFLSPKKELLFISTHLISLYGACLKK